MVIKRCAVELSDTSAIKCNICSSRKGKSFCSLSSRESAYSVKVTAVDRNIRIEININVTRRCFISTYDKRILLAVGNIYIRAEHHFIMLSRKNVKCREIYVHGFKHSRAVQTICRKVSPRSIFDGDSLARITGNGYLTRMCRFGKITRDSKIVFNYYLGVGATGTR